MKKEKEKEIKAMTCKNCIHYEVCSQFSEASNHEYYTYANRSEICECFEDKSLCVYLPFSTGTVLYRVTNPYRQEPKVTEFVVTNFVMQGKKHELMVEVRVNGVPGRNVMRLRQFYRTKEEAEKELAERRKQ